MCSGPVVRSPVRTTGLVIRCPREMRGTPHGGIIKTKGRPCGGPRCNETSGRPCQQASHQSVTMIIVRFMEVSLGYAQIQVNTQRRVIANAESDSHRAALALTRQQRDFIEKRNASFGRRGYDLRQAMEDRLEKLSTIARQ